MATIQDAAALKASEDARKAQNDAAYNLEVAEFVEEIRSKEEEVRNDMKIRQLPEGLKGNKVYGPHSAVRSTFNAIASIIGKMADVAAKLKKGTTVKVPGKFIGFAVPGFIKPEMAIVIGLKEGNVLWPIGQKPIFSAACLTKFFSHRVMANGLVHDNNLSSFTCDEQMKRLFAPYVASSVKPGEPPIDLNNCNYKKIQQLIKNFVETRSKDIPGPSLTDELRGVFMQLDNQFDQLQLTKDAVKASIKRVVKSQNDLVKAKGNLDAGQITQELFNAYAVTYKTVSDEKEVIYTAYRKQAKAMGI